MATLLLSAVGGSRWKPGVALPADHLVAVELLSKKTQAWFNHTTTQTQHQVKGRLLLNVVVAQSTTVLELLTSEDKTLLIWRYTYR